MKKKKTNKKHNIDLITFSKCSKILQILPVVQLSPFNPASHVHNPSVCRHLSILQLGEQLCEQFVPKYPSLQARNTQSGHRCYKSSKPQNNINNRNWYNFKLKIPNVIINKHFYMYSLMFCSERQWSLNHCTMSDFFIALITKTFWQWLYFYFYCLIVSSFFLSRKCYTNIM